VVAAAVAGWLGVWGLVAGLQAGLMVRSSRSGKLRERDRLLDDLPWRGDEWVLDVGCGRRGLLLIGAARRLTTGRAVGLDLWRRQDQAGNDPASTMANAEVEGVAERVELRDGDARRARRRPSPAAPLRHVPAGAGGDRNQAPAPTDGESPA
jgi:hypothetical protein